MSMNWEQCTEELAKQQAIAIAAQDRVCELKKIRESLMREAVAKGLKPHACCNVEANLTITERGGKVTGMFKGQALQGDRIVKTCGKCGARHHEVDLDPIEIKVTAP